MLVDVEVSEERHFDPGDHFERVELAFEDGELRKGSEADSVLDIWDRINWKMMSSTQSLESQLASLELLPEIGLQNVILIRKVSFRSSLLSSLGRGQLNDDCIDHGMKK